MKSRLILDLNSIEEADIPHVTVATLGKTEKITLIQVLPHDFRIDQV